MVKIVQKEDKILRKTAKEVPLEEIRSPKLNKILEDMKTALSSQDDGVAIAAPQIGESLRIFVVSGKVLDMMESGTEDLNNKEKMHEDLIFINPVLLKISKDKKEVEEGCLSVRWLYGKVKRSKKAVIKAYDENGQLFERGASGLLAQIFQHEMDHLEGVLFTDKATEVRDMPPSEPIKN